MSEPPSSVLFQCGSARLDRTGLREFAKVLAARVTKTKSFDVLVTRDAELQRLNREFLGLDYPTDVLSFPEPPGGDRLGEMAISLDRARAQASEHGHDVDTEIRILMLHGALHLTGMDHETDGGRMRRAEIRWRKIFELPSGLIERVRK